MRFTDDGPDFPAEVLDALLSGEVVFVYVRSTRGVRGPR
jgi:hypothetical protein